MAQAELGHSRALAPLLEAFTDLLPPAAIGDDREVIDGTIESVDCGRPVDGPDPAATTSVTAGT